MYYKRVSGDVWTADDKENRLMMIETFCNQV